MQVFQRDRLRWITPYYSCLTLPDLSAGAVPVRQAQVGGPAEIPLPQHTGAVFGFARIIMNRNVLLRRVVSIVESSAGKPDWESLPGKAQPLKFLGTA